VLANLVLQVYRIPVLVLVVGWFHLVLIASTTRGTSAGERTPAGSSSAGIGTVNPLLLVVLVRVLVASIA
jgi:hypothetical protein